MSVGSGSDLLHGHGLLLTLHELDTRPPAKLVHAGAIIVQARQDHQHRQVARVSVERLAHLLPVKVLHAAPTHIDVQSF